MERQASYHHGNLRQALIDRAIEVIASEGVVSLSLRAIARDLGVSHAAPVRHFSSKAELLSTIVREGVQSLAIHKSKDVGKADATALERLKQASKGYVDWARRNPVYHLILRNQDVTKHADDELKQSIEKIASSKRELIEQAKREGWKKKESVQNILLQIMGLNAGLAVIATDPIYETPLRGSREKENFDAAIDSFFSA